MQLALSSEYYRHLLASAQRLRAKVYAEDGALRASEISPDGLHLHPADEYAWQLLSVSEDGAVRGCARYISHPNTVPFSQLGIRKAAIAHSAEWGAALRISVDAEVAEAKRRGLAYVELGGWALDASVRGTVEAVRIALATYSLARVLGGSIGITNATRRHCSAAILRKIGGEPLRIRETGSQAGPQTQIHTALPSYYDPQYECEMEVIRFDSERPNPRYEPWIKDLSTRLMSALVVQATDITKEQSEQFPAGQISAPQEIFEWGREARRQEAHRVESRKSESWRLGRGLAHTVQ